MIRTFHPVGQGTFVMEQFKHGHNVVFDCGSVTSLPWTQHLIQTSYFKDEPIRGVFISSLDREHAGGLETLMQWCRVQKVFIPYLEPDQRAATLLRYLCEGGQPEDFLARLIADPNNALSAYQNPTSGISVLTQVSRETEREMNVFDKIMPMYLMPWKSVDGFRVSVDETMDWVYQVQVYQQRADMEQLTDSLAAVGADPGWIASATELQRVWQQEEIRRKLTQAYGQLAQPLCAVSLAVYSGPERQDCPMYELFTERELWTRRLRIWPGCLYTGSLYLREKQIRARFLQHFDRYRLHTGCLLLPGHGSETMFHREVLPGRRGVVVITADNENQHCLPHGSVVRCVIDHRIPLYLVNEYAGSTLRFVIQEAAICHPADEERMQQE